jgi:hypothetical protein
MDLGDLNAKIDLVLKRQQELLDRQAIRDCLTAYCRGMDRRDLELAVSCYHPDGVDDHGQIVADPETFVAWADGTHAHVAVTQHMITNHTCEIDGDVAHAETYWFAANKHLNSEAVTLCGGRYIDRLERRGGQWRIAVRKCTVEWGGTPVADPLPQEALKAHSVAGRYTRDRADPSYSRPFTIDRPRATPAA